MLFITFILISYKLSHKLKFVLSLFPPPSHHSRCCVWPTNARLQFSMNTRNSQNIAARRPFWFYSVFLFFRLFWLLIFFSAISFLPLFCCCCCRCCCGVCCRAPSLQRPHCKLSRPPPNLLGWRVQPAFALSASTSPSSVVVFRLLLLYLFSEAQKRVAATFVAFLTGFLYMYTYVYIFGSSVLAHFRCSLALTKL